MITSYTEAKHNEFIRKISVNFSSVGAMHINWWFISISYLLRIDDSFKMCNKIWTIMCFAVFKCQTKSVGSHQQLCLHNIVPRERICLCKCISYYFAYLVDSLNVLTALTLMTVLGSCSSPYIVFYNWWICQ